MKVSFVLTVGAVLGGLLVGSGCLKHSMVNVQPISNPVVVDSPRLISPPSPASLEPITVQIKPVSAPLRPVSAPANSLSTPVRYASTQTPMRITDAPPPPLVEVVRTVPDSDYAWIPGHWRWQNQWVWVGGGWATVPHPDAVWIPGRWTSRFGGWVWIQGYWR